MNAFSAAQQRYDNAVPNSYYDGDTLERAHQKAIDDFWGVGYIAIDTDCQSRRYAREPISLDLDEVFEAVSTGGKNDEFFPLRRAIRENDDVKIAEAAKRFIKGMEEHAEKWIKENVSESYGS